MLTLSSIEFLSSIKSLLVKFEGEFRVSNHPSILTFFPLPSPYFIQDHVSDKLFYSTVHQHTKYVC